MAGKIKYGGKYQEKKKKIKGKKLENISRNKLLWKILIQKTMILKNNNIE